MTNQQLRTEVARLRDQLTGARLMGAAMADEVAGLMQLNHNGNTDEVQEGLQRLGESADMLRHTGR